jgi:hypothetical protein
LDGSLSFTQDWKKWKVLEELQAMQALISAAAKFERIKNGTERLNPAPRPKRLINIYTGELESNCDKPFVTASYIWRPEMLPKTPTYGWVRRHGGPFTADFSENQKPGDGSNKAPKMKAWKTNSKYFDGWTELLAMRYPEVVQRYLKPPDIKFICPSHRPDGISPTYLEEVFDLVANEAHLRGISHVWVDSWCIDQSDPADIADQIPKMRDYYSQASSCVVIAEAMRQRLAPNLRWEDYVTSNEQAKRFNLVGLESTANLLDSWMVGFHDERIWTLQETFLAKEVVARAGNIRLCISKAFEPGIRKMYEMSDFHGSMTNAMPLSSSEPFYTTESISLSPQYCLRLSRWRKSRKDQDRIYGVLGLFPEAIRYSLPVDYDLSIATISAIFGYLRVADGDLSVLLTVSDPEFGEHNLGQISWIPRGFGYAETELRDFIAHKDLITKVYVYALDMTMVYVQVQEIITLEEHRNRFGGYLDSGMDKPNIGIGIGNPEDVIFYGGKIETPRRPSEMDLSGFLSSKRSTSENVVIASPGIDRRILDNGEEEVMWTWLILSTKDGGTTWFRHGVLFTDQLSSECGGKQRFHIF